MSKYLAVYAGREYTGDTVSEVHGILEDELGKIDVEDIEFYQLTPIEVECKVTYTIKPQF